MHVKAGECVYGGDGVALRRHWWLSTNTHMHTHKHRICFHKSPVIPLQRTPEKVRQLPPISKRLKKNVSVNEYVHVRVCVQTAVWKDAAHLQFVWFLIPHVFLKLSDFTKSFIHPPLKKGPCLPAQVCVYC